MGSKGGSSRRVALRLGGGWMGGAIRRGLIGRFVESTVACLMQVRRKGMF